MKCLDNEEKSECSQAVKLKLKLICFTFLVGSSWILTCIRAYLTCSFGHLRKNLATHVRSTELKLDSIRP